MTDEKTPRCASCGAPPVPAEGDLCPKCLAGLMVGAMDDDETLPMEKSRPERSGDETPIERIGPYVIGESLGRGGFGEVFLAEQNEPIRRKVALKIIKPGMDSRDIISRFEAERQILALMDHPNIARVLDAGTTESGRPYFVMELVQGIPLTQYCDENHLGVRERLGLFEQVCRGVEHAHQKGVIHRDLKPSNILVGEVDGVPVVKIIDFGIAKAVQGGLSSQGTIITEEGQLIGTPQYMSPEQVQGLSLDIDTRTDVYSLGVILYELLVGEPPITKEDLQKAGFIAMVEMICEQDAPRVSTKLRKMGGRADLAAGARSTITTRLERQLQGDLEWILQKALEKDRDRRYATASALALDVQRHLRSEPVEASPPSSAYRIRKFVRRNRVASIAAVLIFFAITTSAIVSTIQWRAAEKSRRETEQARLVLQGDKVDALVKDGRSREAIPYMASILKSDPENRLIAQRLVSVLMQRSFPVPVGKELAHGSRMHAVEYSPDGRWIATAACATFDGRGMIWDAATGEPVHFLRHRAITKSNCVEDIHFSADSRRVVTVSRAENAMVWDVETGKRLAPAMEHGSWVVGGRLNGDGSLLATMALDGQSAVWEVATGKMRYSLDYEGKRIMNAHFSPDDRLLFVNYGYTKAILFDAATGKRLHEFDNQGWGQFSPDGKMVALHFPWSPNVGFWDVESGETISRFQLDGKVQGLDFSPDGHSVLAAIDSGELVRLTSTGIVDRATMDIGNNVLQRFLVTPDGLGVVTRWDEHLNSNADVWDSFTGERISETIWHGIGDLSIHPQSGAIATSTAFWSERSARMWDPRPGKALNRQALISGEIRDVLFSASGECFLIVDKDGLTVSVWSADNLRKIGQREFESRVLSFDLSEDGSVLAVGLAGGVIYHGAARSLMELAPLSEMEGRPEEIDLSPDGTRLAAANRVETESGRRLMLSVWEIGKGRLIKGKPLQGKELEWHPGGEILASSQAKVKSLLHDVVRDKPMVYQGLNALPSIGRGDYTSAFRSALFSPNGRWVTRSSGDDVVRVFAVDDFLPVTAPLEHPRKIRCLAFANVAGLLASGADDYRARIWNAASRQGEQTCLSMEHDSEVLHVEFSPDDSRLLTMTDKVVRIWDTGTGQPVSDNLRGNAKLLAASFGPKGEAITVVQEDGLIRQWNFPQVPVPVLEWFCEMAESIIGTRLKAEGVPESVSYEEFVKQKESAGISTGHPFYDDFRKWFFMDRSERTVSPWSDVEVDEFVRTCLQTGNLEQLKLARRLQPKNREVLEKLGMKLGESQVEAERKLGEFLLKNVGRLTGSPGGS